MAEAGTEVTAEGRKVRVEQVRLLSVDDVKYARVRNPKGEDLGSIENLMVDARSGRIVYAVLGYGGFWGFGKKYFAIPWEAMQLRPDQQVFIVNVDRDRLEQSPGLTRGEWPSRGNWELIAAPLPQTVPPAEERRPRVVEQVAPAVVTTETSTPPSPPPEKAPAPSVEVRRETVVRPEGVSVRSMSAADLQYYLGGIDYPAGKQELISYARSQDAPPAAVEALQRFEDKEYRSAADVNQELGRVT
ncbi:MAG TPA: DUF2795 domain-containing protein [Methanomicrobiales archaeon]|nr:DUF2795 domain-containing protein [Methanomicrobiales archaeon]